MQIADLAAINAPNDPTFVGGIGGQVGRHRHLLPASLDSAVDAAANANHSFQTIFRSGGAPCAGIQPSAPTCPLAVSLNTFPSGTLKTPYYYQHNLGVEQQSDRSSVRIDFVGTRGLHEPSRCSSMGIKRSAMDASRRFRTRSHSINDSGMSMSFARTPTAVMPASDRLYATMARTHSARQLHVQSLSRRGIKRRFAGVLHAGNLSPLPGELRRQYGNCDYDVRHNVSAYGMYQIPFRSDSRALRTMFGGWSSWRRPFSTPGSHSAC